MFKQILKIFFFVINISITNASTEMISSHGDTMMRSELFKSQQFSTKTFGIWSPNQTRIMFYTKEDFDSVQGRGSIVIQAPDIDMQMLYNFKTMQRILITEHTSKCEVLELKEAKNETFYDKNLPIGLSLGRLLTSAFINVSKLADGKVDWVETQDWEGTAYLDQKTNAKFHLSNAVETWTFPYCPNKICSNWTRPFQLQLNESLTFDFVEFRDEVDNLMFQIPEGVYCKDLKTDEKRPLPTIFNAFSVEIEIISDNQHSQISVSYSPNIPALAIEVLTTSGGRVIENTKDIIDIHEAMIHHLDAETGECIDWGFVVNAKTVFKTFSPLNIPHINLLPIEYFQSAIYVGQRPCRLGLCPIWSLLANNKIYEYYLPPNDNDPLPVMIKVTQINDDNSTKSEHIELFYNHGVDYVDWTAFDITNCISENDRIDTVILFNGSYSSIEGKQIYFKTALIQLISDRYNINRLRIQSISIDNDINLMIIATFTLLEDPRNIINDIDRSKSSNQILTNTEVFDQIADDIESENLVLYENYTKFSAIAVAKLPDTSTNKLSSLRKYFPQKNRELDGLESKALLLGMEEERCADLCESDTSFECETFVFCRSTGRCQLYSQRANFDNHFSDNTDCTTYIRDMKYDFNVQQNLQLKAKSSDRSTENNKLEECLLQCKYMNEADSPCHSFDLCKTDRGNKCTFHAQHFLETSEDERIVNSNCSLYSRNYLREFVMYRGSTIKNDDWNRVVISDSVEGCAEKCALNEKGCTDFEMCSEIEDMIIKYKCVLMFVKDGVLEPDMTQIKVPDCDHYRMSNISPKNISDRTTISTSASTDAPKPTIITEIKEYGYSPGVIAILAISMIVLGIFIGIGCSMIYIHRKFRKGIEDIIPLSRTNKKDSS